MYTHAHTLRVAAKLFCQIYRSEVQPKYSTAFVSDVGFQKDWPSHMRRQSGEPRTETQRSYKWAHTLLTTFQIPYMQKSTHSPSLIPRSSGRRKDGLLLTVFTCTSIPRKAGNQYTFVNGRYNQCVFASVLLRAGS